MITVQSAEELMNRQTLRGCGCLTHQLEYGVFFMINRRVLFSSQNFLKWQAFKITLSEH